MAKFVYFFTARIVDEFGFGVKELSGTVCTDAPLGEFGYPDAVKGIALRHGVEPIELKILSLTYLHKVEDGDVV